MKATRAEINERVRLIRAGKPPPLPHNHSEEVFWRRDLKGFGVRQTYTGQASWIVQYKMHGRSRKQALGDVTKLDELPAIEMAKNLWAKMYLDRLDPQAAKAEARRTAKVTYESVVEQFLPAWRHVRAGSAAHYRRYLTGSYFKPLHGLPFDEITHEQITLQLRRIEQASGRSTASTCARRLGVMYKWAIKKGLHPGPSPMLRVDIPQDGPSRPRVLNDDEIRTIWLVCDVWEALAVSGNRGQKPRIVDFPYAIRLLFLTGCRAQEIGDLEWSEVDLKRKELAIPGSRTKNAEPLYLPLTDTAMDILKRVKRRPGEKYVFGTESGKGMRVTSSGRRFDKLVAKVGLTVPPDWTIHDIRRTVRTRMGEIGIDPNIAERVLNHMSHRTEMQRTYDRYTYGPQMRDALTRWEAHLLALIRGTDEKIRAPVLAHIDEARRPVGRRAVLAALKKAGTAMGATDIAAATEIPEKNVRQFLFDMAKAGEVIRAGLGRYLHPDNGLGAKPYQPLSRAMPWKDLNMSRRQWYYLGKPTSQRKEEAK
jgi:integrase